MKKFTWPQYKEPQAHHWIIARLLRVRYGHSYTYDDDRARTVMWMIRELGAKRVSQMLATIQQEDSRS